MQNPHKCDVCSSRPAVLHCAADSAKLCLLCDHQIHSANALSLKHLRYQICGNCRSEPASIRRSANDLVLCKDCDRDSHSHHRAPVEPFSGLPSPAELAAVLGFDLRSKISADSVERSVTDSADFRVPNAKLGDLKTKSLKCELFEQLAEMEKRDLVKFDGDGIKSEANWNDDDEELFWEQKQFSSLVMLSSNLDSRKESKDGDGGGQGEMVWDYDHAYEDSQMWGFHLGKSKECEPLSPQEVKYDAKNHKDFATETSSSSKNFSQDVYEMKDHFSISDDIFSKDYQSNAQFSSESILVPTSEAAELTKSKADMEMMAQNRGNAMIRYKEKKKARRYDKHIRYVSRKASADTRRRVKGRFVKAT